MNNEATKQPIVMAMPELPCKNIKELMAYFDELATNETMKKEMLSTLPLATQKANEAIQGMSVDDFYSLFASVSDCRKKSCFLTSC